VTRIGPEDVQSYWQAVSSGDERAAQQVVDALTARDVPAVDIFDGLVIPTQERVGERWATNDWTVAREHAATAISEAMVIRVGATIPEPSSGERPLLVTCVEREWHALPALVVTHTLREWGRPVHYLGANVSPETVVGRILDLGPRAVLVSASLSSSLPRVRRLIEAVCGTGTPVILGGRAFDPGGVRAARLGGTAYAPDLARLADVLQDLPRHVPPAAALRHPGVGEALAILAAADEVCRDVLRGSAVDLGRAGAPAAMPPDDWRVVLATYVPHVIGCVVGGLLAEDPTVPGEARDWLTAVLELRGGDADAVDQLWKALSERLREYPEAVRLLEHS
jgi:methanogenic corrinoid protein MtbC1